MIQLDLTNDEISQLLGALLENTFLHNYIINEQRLVAYKKTDGEIRTVIARAAVDSFLALLEGTALADKLRESRDRYVEQLVAMRPELFEALRLAARPLPRPPFRGPISSIWAPARTLSLVCVGPRSGELGKYVSEAHARFMSEVPLLAVEDTSWDELADRSVVLYGGADNAVVAELLGRADVRIEASGMTVSGRTFEGEHLALIACQPHPRAADHGVLIYTASDEADIVGINNIYHGPTDWVVARRVNKSTYEPVARGVFTKPLSGDWMTPES